MRLLMINRYFYPDHAPTGVLLSDLAFGLSQQGVEVTIITSRSRYDGSAPLAVASETVNGVEIHRVWSSKVRRLGFFGRSLEYGSFYMTGAWRLWHLARRADIIVAKTDPPLLSVPVAIIAKLRGARTVNWLQDLFPEVAEALDVGGDAGRRVFRLLGHIRNWSLSSAANNVVVGDAMAATLRKQGLPQDKIRVISNWADGNLIIPIAPTENEIRKAWGLTDNFVVGYAGNLGRAHDVDTILEAMTLLQDRGNHAPPDDVARRIAFVFVGGGVQRAKLTQEISRRQLTNVQVHAYQPQENLAEMLGVPDLHLVSLKPHLEGLILPSKVYGIAAAGRPMLFVGAAEGEIAQLMDRNKCGFTIEPGDAEALASRILHLASDPELCAAMGVRARAAFEDQWDKERAVERWVEVLKSAAREE